MKPSYMRLLVIAGVLFTAWAVSRSVPWDLLLLSATPERPTDYLRLVNHNETLDTGGCEIKDTKAGARGGNNAAPYVWVTLQCLPGYEPQVLASGPAPTPVGNKSFEQRAAEIRDKYGIK